MLSELEVQATLPAQDMARARQFYAEKLGFTPESDLPDGGAVYRCRNSAFLLFPSQGRSEGQFTQVAWMTDNIEAEVEALRTRGVVFEEYDLPGFKTTNGIADFGPTRGAWFKDSEGNLLGLVQLS